MRISDWSSDVCSSDLTPCTAGRGSRPRPGAAPVRARRGRDRGRLPASSGSPHSNAAQTGGATKTPLSGSLKDLPATSSSIGLAVPHWSERSEEHQSELQSLMRSSFAVFWLKKKKKKQ